jgi:hypothetical protein
MDDTVLYISLVVKDSNSSNIILEINYGS